LPFGLTFSRLWPQMVFGVVGLVVITSGAKINWVAVAMCLPVFVGPFLVIPFAISSSHPIFGAISARLGLWQLPEEQKPPVIIRALNLPAVALRADANDSHERLAPLSTDDLLRLGADMETATVPSRSSDRIAA